MKKNSTLLIGAGLLLAGVSIYLLTRTKKQEEGNVLNMIADEGYETAYDILFPNQKSKGEKLHYGPVLPEAV